MKFLHTADWHLGNSMFDIDRTEEFNSFLHWLKETITKEKIEVLIVAGDIFDTINPPVVSKCQYNDFLAALLDTDCKNVIIIGGNHDSGTLLDSEKKLLKYLNVHVVGSINNLQPEDMIFELYDKSKNVIGICAAVPFARENELRNYIEKDEESKSFSDLSYGSLYKKVFEAADKVRNGRNIPIIATGHLYAANLEGRFSEETSETKSDDGKRKIDVVGNLGSVHANVFPEGFDYVALGHIHYSTMVDKQPRIRYSGSPFVLGFDEAHLPRHVLVGQINKEQASGELFDISDLEIKKVEVPSFVKFKRLSGTCKDIKEELEKLKSASKSNNPKTYLELYYKWEQEVNIYEELEEISADLPENICVANRKMQDTKSILSGKVDNLGSDELKNLSAEEIFRSLILSKKQFEGDDEAAVEKYLPYFKQILTDIENGVPDENK